MCFGLGIVISTKEASEMETNNIPARMKLKVQSAG